MLESKPQPLGRGSPELLELMIHVALILEQFARKPSGAAAK